MNSILNHTPWRIAISSWGSAKVNSLMLGHTGVGLWTQEGQALTHAKVSNASLTHCIKMRNDAMRGKSISTRRVLMLSVLSNQNFKAKIGSDPVILNDAVRAELIYSNDWVRAVGRDVNAVKCCWRIHRLFRMIFMTQRRGRSCLNPKLVGLLKIDRWWRLQRVLEIIFIGSP